MTCIYMHMRVGLSALSDTQGFLLSLGLGHGLDLAEMDWGIIEAGCCDTSQHCWESLNEDWAFTVDA